MARQLLQQVIEADPKNEMAWYLYAHAAENRQTAIHCLEKTLEINAFNERARQELAQLQNGLQSRNPQPSANQPHATLPTSQPSSPKTNTARPKPKGLDQRYIIWGLAAGIGILFFCGLAGLFVIVQQFQLAGRVAPTTLPLPGYSSTIPTLTPLPQISSAPTQDPSCTCDTAIAYLNRTAQRYQTLNNDVTSVEQAVQNQTITQLDFALLSSKARTLYHDQLTENPPPCLQSFQSKTISMLWNWQQSMEYLAGGQYNTAEVFIQGFIDQVTALEDEGKKMRGLLPNCPGNNPGPNSTF